MFSLKPQLLAVFLGVLFPASLAAAASLSEGAWVDTHDSGYVVGIEEGRYTVSIGGKVKRIARVLSLDGDVLHLCDNGRDVFLKMSRDGNGLSLRALDSGETHRLRGLPEWPEALRLIPISIPAGKPLAEARVLEVQGELWRRMADDQGAFRMPRELRPTNPAAPWLPPPPPQPRELASQDFNLIAVQADNAAFVRKLITEIGWIDVRRFGYSASNAAFLLVQHSYDLSLMMPVLEAIERDVEAGYPMGEAYALLYDRVHLMLGEKQRYGTQVTYDETGEPLLLPVEKPDELGELRKALEMQPIDEYLRALGGSQVRISPECGALHQPVLPMSPANR